MSVTATNKKTSIGGGLYKDTAGGFWVRPWVQGKRTWRKLASITQRSALEEARKKLSDHAQAQGGKGSSPFQARGETFEGMADLYLAAQCPNKRLEPRPEAFCAVEKRHIDSLKGFFGNSKLADIKLMTLPQYHKWRTSRVARAGNSGNRAVERELNTLSNVLNYAVGTGQLDFNYIRQGRPRFQKTSEIEHAREFAPADGDELHTLALHFFSHRRSEVIGWLSLFSALTGCRNTELRALRVDAKTKDEPGFVSGNYLFIRRAKGGVYPYIPMTPELQACYEAFIVWHKERYPNNPYFFPARDRKEAKPVDKGTFGHALQRACEKLKMAQKRPHGFRSFYVTKRRSDGIPDNQIAAEIGDQTVSLISRTYGDLPPNWTGQKKLSFLPAEGLPSWERWNEGKKE